MTFTLRAVSPEGSPEEVVLPLDGPGSSCSLRLACLPGASALCLVFTRDGEAVLRVEIPAEDGETVSVELETCEDGRLEASSPGRSVLTFPAEGRHAALPLLGVAAGESLDLVLVVDGTARRFKHEKGLMAELLLRDGEAWNEQLDRLARFAEAFAEGLPGARFAVLAFGDRMPAGAVAPDLAPVYELYPGEEERGLRPFDPARLRAELAAVPPTAGGDFVDALADALHACQRLRWNGNARKVVVVWGDSPGHSIQHPLRKGADIGVRMLDVDLEARALHGEGVELVTIYHDPPAGLGLAAIEFRRDLLQGARSQYARIASLPSLSFEASSFDPEEAAAVLRSREGIVARGAAPGHLVELTPA